MSIEKIERTILVGYQARCCVCGVTGPLAETFDDATAVAAAHGWEMNTFYTGSSSDDYCPVCERTREANLDSRYPQPEPVEADDLPNW